MLFLLVGLMLIASACVLCLKKNRESFFLLGMCFSLLMQFSGILIFIAKKGGFTQDILRFLYFSIALKNRVQYFYITLDQMGYLIALGRYLFPLFLLQSSLHYSMIGALRRHPGIKGCACILPLASLILYFPPVFKAITKAWPALENILVEGSYLWVLCFVVLSMMLLLWEWRSITIRYCRRHFACMVGYLASLSGLYLLYCGQDPAQVYRFYSYDYLWSKGIGYLQLAPSMTGYVGLVVVNVICCALGLGSLLRYTQNNLMDEREETVLERKFDIARTGASVFVHSIKNQLLANRVLEKRIYQELDKPQPDLSRIRDDLDQLNANNELLLTRSDELYRTVKRKSVRLVPTTLNSIVDTTLTRFMRKYPDAPCRVEVDGALMVLADVSYLSEALYNLLTNAWEANVQAGRAERPVQLRSRQERLYTVFEVEDAGLGMTKREQRRVFDPFYSSKNSNTSWGMGLYHARTIVRAHLGSIRVESGLGKGSCFLVLLPRYDGTRQVKNA